MTRNEIASVGVRLFGIGTAVNVLHTLPFFLKEHLSPLNLSTLWVSTILAVVVGIMCVRFPMGVAALLLPKTPDSPKAFNWTSDQAIGVGAFLLGLYTLTQAVLETIRILSLVVLWENSRNTAYDSHLGFYTVQLLAQYALAGWLLLGARGLRRWVLRLRGRGYEVGPG